jgi:molybdate transport system regulatory protein
MALRYIFLYITIMGTENNSSGNGETRATYRWKGRIWLEGAEGTFLGYGRVVLLERIAEFGSISKAARSMEMSYKHAWDLVDSMNRQAAEPLVETASGGKGGGGTKLTAAGRRAIDLFRGVHDRLREFLAKETIKTDLQPG